MKKPLLGIGIVLVSFGVVLITSAFLNPGPSIIFLVGASGGIFLSIGIVILLTRQFSGVFIAPQPVTQASTQKVCPTCGLLYGPEAQFCQKDATPLQASQ